MTSESEIDAILEKRLQKINLVKKIDEMCTGTECIKNNIVKLQEKLNNKFNCPVCGQKTLEVGDSYCRNCSEPVEAWDELDGWQPYHKRSRGK